MAVLGFITQHRDDDIYLIPASHMEGVPFSQILAFRRVTLVPFLSYEIRVVTFSGNEYLVTIVEPRMLPSMGWRDKLREIVGTRHRTDRTVDEYMHWVNTRFDFSGEMARMARTDYRIFSR